MANELQEAMQNALMESNIESNTEAAYNARLMEAIKYLAAIFVQTQLQSKASSVHTKLLKEFDFLLE